MRLSGVFGLAFSLMSTVSGAALAQQAPERADSEDVIVVTSQFRPQPLQDVPLPISAITSIQLEETRIENLNRLADLVPGLEVFEQTIQNPSIIVRGVDSGGSSANVENRVSVFYDGISIGRAQGALIELFDLERVEVLKGPQGTLYGRGSTAGALAVVSARPRFDETSGELWAGLENYNGHRFGGIFNVGVNDQLALRGALTRRVRDGFIRNLATGDTNNNRDMLAARVSGSVQITPDITATLILNGQRDRSNSNVFASITIPVPGANFDQEGDNTPWNPSPLQTDPFGPAFQELGDRAFLERDVAGATFLVEADLGDWSVQSISGYRYLKSDDFFDVDGSYLFIVNGLEDTRLRQWSTEVRAVWDNGGAFSFIGGASVFQEHTDYTIYLEYDPLAIITIVTPGTPFTGRPINPVTLQQNLLPLPFPRFASESGYTRNDTLSYSAYLDGTWQMNDAIRVSAGLRYTYDDKSLLGERPVTNFGIFFPSPGPQRASRSESFEAFQPRLVVDWRLAPGVLTYASVTTGYRSGVIPDPGTNLTAPVVEPEFVTSYELGMRTETFDRRLRLNGSIFRYDWTDFQSQVLDPQTNLLIAANAGEASALGAELEGDLRLTQNVSLFGNVNLMDATYDDFVSGGQDFSGNRLVFSPRFRGTLGASFNVPVGADWNLRANGFYVYRSKQFFSNDNTALESQDGFGVMNLNVTLSAPQDRFELSVFSQNLFDERYMGDVGNTGRAFGTPTWVPAQPRVYGFEIRTRF
ncbi:TonB-dependent receptor [Hyphomonadaceae bacterium BL14]|nr:TonB-dependent receptor [Hyphomonadaceae bacterium BL14]